MLEQDKDEISRFFRKAARAPQIKFVENDWKNLEARLDAATDMTSALRIRRQAMIISAISFLFVATGTIMFFSAGQQNTLGKSEKSSNVTIATPQHLTGSVASKNEKNNEPQAQVALSATKKQIQDTVHSFLTASTRKEVNGKQESIIDNTTNFNADHLATAMQSNKPGNKPALTENTSIEEGISAPLTELATKEITVTTTPEDTSAVDQKNLIHNKSDIHDSLPDSKELLKQSRWNVMFTLSPDFSSTGLSKFTTPGEAIGVTAYYRINNSFSISAGVVKSNKLYWDNGNAYKPVEPGFWAKKTNGVVPGKIEGDCGVLEIPIGIQYDLKRTEKSRMYVAGSFTSYLMFKESYQYTFDSPNPGAIDHWNVKKSTLSPFSITNFAIGYERKISNRMMLGLSPYIKIPLSGIGAWANVKLYSVGAAFTLRYQFQKKKLPDRLMPVRSPD